MGVGMGMAFTLLDTQRKIFNLLKYILLHSSLDMEAWLKLNYFVML
jgi:hypothetical protein